MFHVKPVESEFPKNCFYKKYCKTAFFYRNALKHRRLLVIILFAESLHRNAPWHLCRASNRAVARKAGGLWQKSFPS